jgi:hypothetical protein
MKRTVLWLGAVLALGCVGSLSQANPYFPGCPAPPSAPDACGPGYYVTDQNGTVYGPNYPIYPPFPPYNGPMYAPPVQQQGPPGGMIPTHPYARSPRDFFMVPTP